MFINTSKTKIFIKKINESKDIPYFFLHGFTGTADSWNNVIKKLNKYSYVIDIPGHRKSSFQDIHSEYTINDWCYELYILLNELEINKINLCGYSMGGRMAIAFANKFPDKINSLILESTSLGLNESEVRSERFYKDKELAKNLREDLISFMNEWGNNTLFKNQKTRNKTGWEEQNKNRLLHDKNQLAHALEVFSPSNMPYYDKAFQDFDFPIHVINGSEDDKYIKIGAEMMRLNPNVKQYIIKESGHNTHLENLDMFIDVLNNDIYE